MKSFFICLQGRRFFLTAGGRGWTQITGQTMSTNGNFIMFVAKIIDSGNLLKIDVTGYSGGYSSKHYYYFPGNFDAFVLYEIRTTKFIYGGQSTGNDIKHLPHFFLSRSGGVKRDSSW